MHVLSSRPHAAHTDKSPDQLARDAVRYSETVGGLTQRHDIQRGTYDGLLRDWTDAKNAGIDPMHLPQIHAQMSPQDIQAASAAIAKMRGQPTSAAVHTAAPTAITPQIMQQPTGTNAPLNAQPSALAPSAPVKASPAAAPDPFAGLIRTPTGLQAPALRPDGSQMSNPDGTARYVGTLANKVPPSVESRVLDTGVGPTNARGETKMQTTSGPVVEVDPFKDLKTSWLAKGDSLLPKGADRGVVIDPKYGGGVGYATGDDTARAAAMTPPKPAAPASPTPSAPKSLPQPGIPENPFNVAAASTNPIQPSRDQMLTNPLMFPPSPGAVAPQSIAMGGKPAPAPSAAGALGAKFHNNAVAGVNQAGTSAVMAGVKATDATANAGGAVGDFTTGLVTGKAPVVDPEEEKRRRMSQAATVPFEGFGSGNKF